MKAIGLSILSVFVFFVGWSAYQYYPLGMPVESPFFTQYVLRPTFWVLAATVAGVSYFGFKKVLP